MPRKPIDYSRTVMYEIRCNNRSVTEVYVGHTTDFNKRRSMHKMTCTNTNCKAYNLRLYETIRANGGWGNWVMFEIEKFPCADVHAATRREQILKDELHANLNMRNPIATCEHGRRRFNCRDCSGNSFCEHERRRFDCRDCGGGAFCEHLRRREQCRDCDGRSICEHSKFRSQCRECKALKEATV